MRFDDVLLAMYLAVGLLVGLVVHEYAHALVASRLGDPTPRQAGRLTLNPRPHVDPFGTLVLPAILLLPVLFGRTVFLPFAYAKPQPLSPWNLTNRTRSGIWIALAGPACNVLIAFIAGGLFRLSSQGQVGAFLGAVVLSNVVLGVMNLVPLPGLDGARVLVRFLPPRAQEVYRNLEQYLALFILLVFFILPGPIFAFVGAIGDGICSLAAGTQCF